MGATELVLIGLTIDCVVIPIIGAVAALVGIVLAIISLFVHRDPPPPPKSNAEKYVEAGGDGKKFISSLAPVPPLLCSYSLTPLQVGNGTKDAKFSLSITPSKPATLDCIELQFSVGDNDVALFGGAPDSTLSDASVRVEKGTVASDGLVSFRLLPVNEATALDSGKTIILTLMGAVGTTAGSATVTVIEQAHVVQEHSDALLCRFQIVKS